jgi:hypothetical protein
MLTFQLLMKLHYRITNADNIAACYIDLVVNKTESKSPMISCRVPVLKLTRTPLCASSTVDRTVELVLSTQISHHQRGSYVQRSKTGGDAGP